MIEMLRNEAAWEKAWKDDQTTGVNLMKSAGIEPRFTFGAIAAQNYNEQSFNDEGRRRSARIIGWLENQGVNFNGASVLDIGAASGIFSIPFAQRGADVTAVEPSLPFTELLAHNNQKWADGKVKIVRAAFEDMDTKTLGWNQAFDFVFVSMCPAITDWEMVEKVISCARKFCYISLAAGPKEHSLTLEILPLLNHSYNKHQNSEMMYLLQLLYLKGYAFHSLVTKEMKARVVSRAEAIQEVLHWLNFYNYPVDENTQAIIEDYLDQTYPGKTIPIKQGGRFGKVLIQLEEQSMFNYS
ncbi:MULTISPECIES: bifunctional 2-polyprenyl-6-hydroxyphenol methylase/3-demethylubiquinol 3-O-methyltransferase UbiG [Paenibacillus]|uniref:Methyltransferase domain-containing protein n=1 Tax=Paenibacillus cisolokensis TaxID=1658519 RepID=A0ABQ4NDY6_9BACL|nr:MULTISPECIES: class I SAM-dependent methyltransferase [Paenibacillus]GIQ66385.1 hypothetical protein PACILC2_49530 [Paenibacillus cisolokensis]